jgi:hypothetical protein
MITEIEKKEIDKKYFPNGFPYKVKTFDPYSYSNSKRLVEPFESLQEYEATVKSVRHSNGLRFFYFIKGLNEADFINEINNQYLNYTLENTENSKHWLSLTYDLVLKGFSIVGKIEDINLRGAFIKWYTITFNDLQTEATEITTKTSTVDKPKAKDYKDTIPDFNLNEFNEITYNLFNYLIGNYQKKGNVKYLNIYKYLKNINKDSYAFNFTQKTYKEYIYKKYEVKLTTFNTANFEFDDKEKPILSGFEQAFRDIKP